MIYIEFSNLFEHFINTSIHLEYRIKSFPINFFWQYLVEVCQIIQNSDFYRIIHNALVTVNLFQIQDMLQEFDLEYTMKFSPYLDMANPNPLTFLSNVQ